MPSTHVYELPMRWADLDSLNHVNNVVYLDYAAEARAVLIAEGQLTDAPPSSMKVEFLRPLLLSQTPVTIVSTIDGDDVLQEICIQKDDGRSMFCRVTTHYATGGALEAVDAELPAGSTRVRRSDLTEAGQVSTTKMFELFQEGRVLFLYGLLEGMSPGRFVVGTVDVRFGSPLMWRHEPYEHRSWISRIGDSSFTVDAEIAGGDAVFAQATSTLVGFDLPVQRSRKLEPAEVEQLGAGMLSEPNSPS
ncbi:MAG: hypothetical protein ABIN55_13690 [Aeromicrobium sp.]